MRAAEQVKELGYAHNLRVLLRKWPKIWSCDGGFARFFPSREETEDSDRVLGETCWSPARFPPPPSGQRILLDGKTRRTEGKVDRRHCSVVHRLIFNSSVSVSGVRAAVVFVPVRGFCDSRGVCD